MEGYPNYILADKIYFMTKKTHKCRACKLIVNCNPQLAEVEENIHHRSSIIAAPHDIWGALYMSCFNGVY